MPVSKVIWKGNLDILEISLCNFMEHTHSKDERNIDQHIALGSVGSNLGEWLSSTGSNG